MESAGQKTAYSNALRGLILRLAEFAATLVFAANQHSGNGVLKDELRLGVGFQHDGILVIRAHAAGELGAVQKMYGDVLPATQGPVEKRFLDVDHRHDSAEDRSEEHTSEL